MNESARPDQPRQRRHRTSLTGTAEPEASTTTHRLDAWIMVDRWRERRDAGRRCQNTCQIAVGSNVVPHRHTTLARIPAWRRLLSVEREAMSTTGRFSFAHTTRACDIAVAHGSESKQKHLSLRGENLRAHIWRCGTECAACTGAVRLAESGTAHPPSRGPLPDTHQIRHVRCRRPAPAAPPRHARGHPPSARLSPAWERGQVTPCYCAARGSPPRSLRHGRRRVTWFNAPAAWPPLPPRTPT